MAVGTGDFAGELVFCCFFLTVVPEEVVVPVGEVYVGFVEDAGPLETCTVQLLTSPTMAKLAIQRRLSTQLIRDSPTMTAAIIDGIGLLVIFVDGVGGFEFPLVVLAIYVFLGVPFGGCFGFFFFWRHLGFGGGCETGVRLN